MRKCTAKDCVKQVDSKWLMCPPHWAALPDELRRNVNHALYTYARTFRNSTTYPVVRQAYFSAVKKAIEFFHTVKTNGN